MATKTKCKRCECLKYRLANAENLAEFWEKECMEARAKFKTSVEIITEVARNG